MTVRMLTREEITGVLDSESPPPGPTVFEALQIKFCEVNGLHIAAPATGQSLSSEARPEGALASSGPDEPTPDSAETVSVELRQRMGRD